MFLFKMGLSRLISKLSLISSTNLLFPFAKMVNSSKDGILLQFRRWSRICSDWTKFHEELSFLKQVFLKNGYPLSFIDNCFKTFVDKLFIKRPQLATVEKKTLFLSLPYLGEISLQTRTKLTKSFKGLLNSCKLQIVFKSQRKLSNVFRFKDRLPFDLVSGVVYKYTCGRCNSTYYGETDRHLKVRSGEHIGISPLTFKKTRKEKRECNSRPSSKLQ